MADSDAGLGLSLGLGGAKVMLNSGVVEGAEESEEAIMVRRWR